MDAGANRRIAVIRRALVRIRAVAIHPASLVLAVLHRRIAARRVLRVAIVERAQVVVVAIAVDLALQRRVSATAGALPMAVGPHRGARAAGRSHDCRWVPATRFPPKRAFDSPGPAPRARHRQPIANAPRRSAPRHRAAHTGPAVHPAGAPATHWVPCRLLFCALRSPTMTPPASTKAAAVFKSAASPSRTRRASMRSTGRCEADMVVPVGARADQRRAWRIGAAVRHWARSTAITRPQSARLAMTLGRRRRQKGSPVQRQVACSQPPDARGMTALVRLLNAISGRRRAGNRRPRIWNRAQRQVGGL